MRRYEEAGRISTPPPRYTAFMPLLLMLDTLVLRLMVIRLLLLLRRRRQRRWPWGGLVR